MCLVSGRGISAVALVVTTAVVAGLVWTIVGNRQSLPYQVRRAELSRWKLITSHGEEPWMLALEPPAALVESLRRQASAKTGRTLVSPSRPVLPVVLRDEYADSLQGEFGLDTLVRAAEGDSLQEAAFEPVCIARRGISKDGATSELLFLALESPAFWQVRTNIYPEHAEIAGTGSYNPAALSALVPISGSDEDFDRALPIRVDPVVDCVATLEVR
jgi:hypothetical protein